MFRFVAVAKVLTLSEQKMANMYLVSAVLGS